MHEFRVWAPDADLAEVVLGRRRLALAPAGGGWWARRAAAAGPGSEYMFSLDGGPPRCPTRARPGSPHGVHGPSHVVDHAAFALARRRLAPPPWARASSTSSTSARSRAEGTFDGAIEQLDHLVDLGVDATSS